jgi:hypothetical protein
MRRGLACEQFRRKARFCRFATRKNADFRHASSGLGEKRRDVMAVTERAALPCEFPLVADRRKTPLAG